MVAIKHIQHIHYYSKGHYIMTYLQLHDTCTRRKEGERGIEQAMKMRMGHMQEMEERANIRTETDLQHVKEQSQSRHCPVANDREY